MTQDAFWHLRRGPGIQNVCDSLDVILAKVTTHGAKRKVGETMARAREMRSFLEAFLEVGPNTEALTELARDVEAFLTRLEEDEKQ